MLDAATVMDEATADATIDEIMRRDPASLTNLDMQDLILAMREKRAMFIEAGEKKDLKKQGLEEDDDSE